MNGWIRTRLTATHRNDTVFFARGASRLTCLGALTCLLLASPAAAQEARWIWSPEQVKDQIPTGEACHFRKVINLKAPEGGQISIAADDEYELFLNGRRINSLFARVGIRRGSG